MEREGTSDDVGALSESNAGPPDHSIPIPDEVAPDAPKGMSFRDFSHSIRGHEPTAPNFPLANALRVHMKIAHHDSDLRSEEDFKSAFAELSGDVK